MQSLRIGKINYLNLFPIFKSLEDDKDVPSFEIIEGVPSRLNKMLREGQIDVSPSSSIEYLRNRDLYEIIEGHSISSFGTVGSILLFSNKIIEELNGQTILTSSQSETSVALLDIILRRFYCYNVNLISSDINYSDVLNSNQNYLLIGDDALIAKKRAPRLYIYDLGDIWFRKTNLPFVFALWIVRKDLALNKRAQLEAFKKSLDKAKNRALANLKYLASISYLKGILSEEEIVSYWEYISFDLEAEHLKGLELFDSYLRE